jgi:hypothetical protein
MKEVCELYSVRRDVAEEGRCGENLREEKPRGHRQDS